MRSLLDDVIDVPVHRKQKAEAERSLHFLLPRIGCLASRTFNLRQSRSGVGSRLGTSIVVVSQRVILCSDWIPSILIGYLQSSRWYSNSKYVPDAWSACHPANKKLSNDILKFILSHHVNSIFHFLHSLPTIQNPIGHRHFLFSQVRVAC
jgi:hypothetical protein